MKVLIISLLVLCSLRVSAQEDFHEKAVLIAQQTPESKSDKIENLATYWLSKTQSKSELCAIVYAWIGQNIRYDVAQYKMGAKPASAEELYLSALRNRKAVCDGYANLLAALLKQMNIQAWVISGYTRKDKVVRDEGHSWVCVMDGQNWRMFDPTWGAGYLQNDRYVSSFNWTWFSVSPEDFVKTHMPFDVAWQCLNQVLLPSCFVNETCNDSKHATFAFSDTLQQSFTDGEKLSVSRMLGRIKRYAVFNRTTQAFYQVWENNLKVIKYNEQAEKLNAVSLSLNNINKTAREASDNLTKYFAFKQKGTQQSSIAQACLKKAEVLTNKSLADLSAFGDIPPTHEENAKKLKSFILNMRDIIRKEISE
jgi:hypothetical protein